MLALHTVLTSSTSIVEMVRLLCHQIVDCISNGIAALAHNLTVVTGGGGERGQNDDRSARVPITETQESVSGDGKATDDPNDLANAFKEAFSRNVGVHFVGAW